jgi:hypothetical protein
MHNNIEKREPKANYLAFYGTSLTKVNVNTHLHSGFEKMSVFFRCALISVRPRLQRGVEEFYDTVTKPGEKIFTGILNRDTTTQFYRLNTNCFFFLNVI